MAHLASPAFLSRMKAIFNQGRNAVSVSHNSWYLYPAVAFSSSNVPDAVPVVFRHALSELRKERGHESMDKEELFLARRFRESIFKAGMLCGYPRTINSLVALHEAMPERLKDTEMNRNPNTGMQHYSDHGKQLLHAMYGDSARQIQDLLGNAYPDLGWFCDSVAYGIVYDSTGLLSQSEIALVLATANIIMDTPRAAKWHLRTAHNSDATPGQIRAVRKIAIEVGKASGIVWKNKIPGIN